MYKKIQHLFDTNEQKIILMGGIPGSGKSTLSKQLSEAGYVIICPDTFRGIVSKSIPGRELWSEAQHESDQSTSAEAWKMAYREAKNALKDGKSIVFDAMLHTAKARRGTMGEFKGFKLPFYAIYLDVTLETAKQRNAERGANGGRCLPDFVLKSKWRQQVFPMIEEGFKEVHYISNDLVVDPMADFAIQETFEDIIDNPKRAIFELHEADLLKQVFPSLYECFGIPQENSHHEFELHNHMITAAELIEDRSQVAVISTLLHDVGKRKTKEFFAKVIQENDHFKVGDKLTVLKRMDIGATFEKVTWNGVRTAFLPYECVEIDSNAHYYDHEKVGAIDARRDLLALGCSEEFANEVYGYILHHMEFPYREASDKHFKNIINKVGPQRMDLLLKIRKADKSSGSSGNGILEVHEKMAEQIKNLLGKE
ncbi:multifunctional tRNA nucleotidyl transferase/2'3'-cyclic phosphodiesterase/2'nucleotidase/phosphatase [compost metagenome]